MEDNHTEVGGANADNAWLNVIAITEASVTVTAGSLGHRRIS